MQVIVIVFCLHHRIADPDGRYRNPADHILVPFYPCGEGAGYAGGIVSSALDGINVAAAVARSLGKDF